MLTPAFLLAAYVTGIILARLADSGATPVPGIVGGTLVVCWLLFHRSRVAWLPFAGMLILAGFLHASLRLAPPLGANHVSRFAGDATLTMLGEVLCVEQRSAGGYHLLVDVHQVIRERSAINVCGDILVSVKEGDQLPRPGQIVRWRSVLRRPQRFGNPGEFDYPLHLAARGIYATAFVAEAAELVILVNHPARQGRILQNLRHDLAEHIDEAVPAETSALVQSLLLGKRGGITDEQQRQLAASGVAHLFAISGLHFGLLALLLYRVGKWLYTCSRHLVHWHPPQQVLPLLLVIPLTAYLLLTGNAWATRRAFIMVVVVALLLATKRRTPPFALLSTAAFVLLLVNPLALFQPGFQLSFAGVTGIMAWVPRCLPSLHRLPALARWPLTLMLTTAAATLATAPATLWHFHQFAPAGLLANLIAVPLVAWGAIPLGLASLSVLNLSSPVADCGLHFTARLIELALATASFISRWPGMQAIPHYLTVAELVVLLGVLIALLPFGKPLKRWPLRLFILLSTAALAWLLRPQIGEFQVTALSVGQGDATLLSLAGEAHYLVDGGGLTGSSFDTGERLVAPALGRLGVDRLRGVILTHNHPDHSSGLTFILDRFPVDAFYLGEEIAELPDDLRLALSRNQVSTRQVKAGWTRLQTGRQQSLIIFAPAQTAADLNERSLVVFAGQELDGVLLTADLGPIGFRQLLAAGLPGPVTLLKLPHHGSRHSDPRLFLDRTGARMAFVSSGRVNTYGFPHEQTIEACTQRQVPLFRTDRQGMLRFNPGSGQWQVETSIEP